MLRIIFEYLSASTRQKIRLTCKKFYNECNANETMNINGPKEIVHKYLENCRLRSLNLSFTRVNVGSLPTTVWQNLGARIHSLKFNYCTFGEQTVEDVIVCCDNMRCLQFYFKRRHWNQLHLNPDRLERLNVTREKLETLYICGRSKRYKRPKLDAQILLRVLKSLYRIYPNVIHHDSTYLRCPTSSEEIDCSFSTEITETNQQNLAEIMTLSLSLDEYEGKKIIEELSKLRYCYNLLLQ